MKILSNNSTVQYIFKKTLAFEKALNAVIDRNLPQIFFLDFVQVLLLLSRTYADIAFKYPYYLSLKF